MTEAGSSTYARLLAGLLQDGAISCDDKILVQFAGEFDKVVTDRLGLVNCTFSNLSPASQSSRLDSAATADAHRMPYGDGEFDHVIGHAGLHHCSRPHEALHEMYRIARRVVLMVENQDSWLMRTAAKAGVVGYYEHEAVADGGGLTGGVDGTGVPNYIYRWTRREVEKAVRSFDPGRVVPVVFHAEWNMETGRVSAQAVKRKLRLRSDQSAALLLTSCTRALQYAASRQGNIFAAVIRKDLATRQPWIGQATSHAPDVR